MEDDAPPRPARGRAPLERLAVAALAHQVQRGGGHRGGHRLEGVEHPLEALLPVEAAGVEADQPVGGQPETTAGALPAGRAEEIEIHAGGDHRDRRGHAPAPQRVGHVLGGRHHQVGGVGEAAGQPHREAPHQPRRQRHVVRVLLVARVIGEDERAPLAPRQAPAGQAEQERMVDVDDVEVERAGDPPEAPRDGQRQREARIGRGGNRRIAEDVRADPPAAAGPPARRSRSGVRAPQAPAAGSRRPSRPRHGTAGSCW